MRSPRLVTLAYQVKLDALTRVKKAIDDRVDQHAKDTRLTRSCLRTSV